MRAIECACRPEILETVIQDRREPIQVTGRFLLDAEGDPVRLTDVSRIEPVALSRMTFDRIEWGGRQLAINPPLTLDPARDEESGQLHVLHDDELDLHVFAPTREQVVDERAEQLLFLWDAYARESPERLTARARQLREELLDRIREITLATQSEGS